MSGVESLYLPEKKSIELLSDSSVACLLCDEQFAFDTKTVFDIDGLNSHLVTRHNFVVADIKQIPDIAGYLKYWKAKLSNSSNMTEFCSVIKTNCGEHDVQPSEVCSFQ